MYLFCLCFWQNTLGPIGGNQCQKISWWVVLLPLFWRIFWIFLSDIYGFVMMTSTTKEQTKLDLKQPEPKPKTSSWIRFRFSRKPKLDILLRPRLCRNGLHSRNFGRNRNIGYNFGRNRLFCRILRDFWFHLIPISLYGPLAILEGFRLPQNLPPKPQLSPYGKKCVS